MPTYAGLFLQPALNKSVVFITMSQKLNFWNTDWKGDSSTLLQFYTSMDSKI